MNRRVPPLFSLMVFLIVLGASWCMAGWYNQYTLYYGNGMRSVINIIAQIFICLITGSWLSGIISDRLKKPLIIYIASTSVASLIILFQKPIFNLHSQSGGFAQIMMFILMFIPLSVMSGSVPLLVRYSIRSINNAGIYMSRILFSISVAVIISVLLSVIVIIPYSGFHALFIAGGISLLFSVMLALYQVTARNDNAQKLPYSLASKRATRMRFRKKRIVLEAGAKLTRAMLYGSVFQAFSFAAMVFIYIRILAKFNHLESVFFYAVVLIIVFAGVTVGSLLYGIVADRPANKYLTLAILQILAGITGLLSFAIHQFLAPDLFREIHDSKSFAELSIRHVLLNSLISFTPSVIHGMSLPLAGRLYPKRLKQIGRTFGQLSTLVLSGLLAGLIITPMVLIPLIGTQATFIVLCLLIVLSGIYLIARDSRLIRGFRLAFVFSALLTFILLIVALRILNVSHLNRMSDGSYEGSTSAVHFVGRNDSSKLVYINNDYYFGTDMESLKEQVLSACITLSLNPDMSQPLFVGFNTGISASIYEKYGVSEIQIVDISPELIRLSSSTFSDENDDIFTKPSVQVTIEDPRTHIMNHTGSYDLIHSGSEQLLLNPLRYTVDFLRICLDKLSDSGIYCQVLPFSRMDTTAVYTYLENAREVFKYTSAWYLSEGRIMLVASKKELIPEYCNLSDVIDILRNPWLTRISSASPEKILAHFLFSEYLFGKMSLPENSDNRPRLAFRLTSSELHHDAIIDLAGWAGSNAPLKVADSCNASSEMTLRKASEINRQLIQQSSPFSGVEQHADDSSAVNEPPFPQYP